MITLLIVMLTFIAGCYCLAIIGSGIVAVLWVIWKVLIAIIKKVVGDKDEK